MVPALFNIKTIKANPIAASAAAIDKIKKENNSPTEFKTKEAIATNKNDIFK